MIKLSKNFTLDELCASSTATAKGIKNDPGKAEIVNLTHLAVHVLQPLRDKMGAITISSGYRSAALNKAVGGVATSQHVKGQAADIAIPSKQVGKVWFSYTKDYLPFDQLIWEHNSAGTYWIHVSYNKEGNRHQVIDNLLKR
jgi:hypothetical protein